MMNKKWSELLIKIEDFLVKPRSRKTLRMFMYLFFGTLVVITTYFLSIPHIGQVIEYRLGDIALEDLRVNRDIRYENVEKTQKKQAEVYKLSPYVFDRDYQVLIKVSAGLFQEFERFSTLAAKEPSYEEITKQFGYIKRLKSLSSADIIKITQNERVRRNIARWAAGYATLIFNNYGLLNEAFEEPSGLNKTGALVRTISGPEAEAEQNWKSSQIIFVQKIFDYDNYTRLSALGDKDFQGLLPPNAKKLAIIRVLQYYYNNPYLHYHAVETKRRKEQASASVKPAYELLKKGLTIVRAGDPIDTNKLEQIAIVNQYEGKTNFRQILGTFITQLILVIGVAFYAFRYSEVSMRDLASHTILATLFYIIIFYAFLFTRVPAIMESNIYFGLFIPMGFMATMSGFLLGARITLVSGLFLSIYLYYLAGDDMSTFIISILSVFLGIYTTGRIKKRTYFIKAALISGGVLMLATIGLDLSENLLGNGTQSKLIAAFLNAFLSIILTTGLLPLYESFFNLPTNFRLMELSDFNHPLLKKMSMEAPSSYAHSLLMASLSERAVAAIEGDTLLTRVGCLYHDIGKMNNAAIYAENKHLKEEAQKNMGLNSLTYAQTIVSHVTDGIKMGRQFRLPEKVISFIPEHHGTSVMQYFYHQALKESHQKGGKKSSKTPVDKTNFQYPGPKPRSKETAIVMIADSVEAASRSVSNPTPEKLAAMVDSIIKNKTDEGQLDEAPLTLSDMRLIKESFMESLLSTYHIRPKYPTRKQTSKLEEEQEGALNAKEAAAKSAKTSQKASKPAVKKAATSQKSAAPKKTVASKKAKSPEGKK